MFSFQCFWSILLLPWSPPEESSKIIDEKHNLSFQDEWCINHQWISGCFVVFFNEFHKLIDLAFQALHLVNLISFIPIIQGMGVSYRFGWKPVGEKKQVFGHLQSNWPYREVKNRFGVSTYPAKTKTVKKNDEFRDCDPSTFFSPKSV